MNWITVTTPISSTVIRRLVTMGHMETAEALLGHPFALQGRSYRATAGGG